MERPALSDSAPVFPLGDCPRAPIMKHGLSCKSKEKNNESDEHFPRTSERAVLRSCCSMRIGAFVWRFRRQGCWLRPSVQNRSRSLNSLCEPSRGRPSRRRSIRSACFHRGFVASELHEAEHTESGATHFPSQLRSRSSNPLKSGTRMEPNSKTRLCRPPAETSASASGRSQVTAASSCTISV